MGFLKKILTAIGAFLLILWGGAGTQSNSMLLQGGGFIGLLIGLVILYIFIKMAWRAMGCLPSFLIITGIISFIIYAIGGFNNGVNGVIPSLKAFLGQQDTAQATEKMSGQFSLIDQDDIEYEENGAIVEEDIVEDVPEPVLQKPQPQQQSANTFKKLMGSLGGQQQAAPAVNPADFPAVYGSVRVINGDTLMMNNHYIRLYGIDAPETNQNCANKNGRSYQCGRVAATWLRDWIMDNKLECRIMQRDAKGNMVGVCSLGQYDLGAAMVNAGWALAYTKYTSIYLPYQEQAMKSRVGLWQGKFYTPEDWRRIKSEKPKIKVTKPKTNRNSMWSF